MVVVPDSDVDLFRERVDLRWRVLAESAVIQLIPGLDLATLSEEAGHRYGWYAQQFAKLGGLILGSKFDETLVWDSDTLPLRKPVFRDGAGRVVFYASNEFHAEYFHQISRFLGLEKEVHASFIAQSMLVPNEWFEAFLAHVESLHGAEWGAELLRSIDFDETYAFSEFESLGTFFFSSFPDKTRFSGRNWSRNGTLHFGSPRLLPPDFFLRAKWDFVSFESWQKPWWKGIPRILRRR